MTRRDLLKSGLAAVAGAVCWPFVSKEPDVVFRSHPLRLSEPIDMDSGRGVMMYWNGEMHYCDIGWAMKRIDGNLYTLATGAPNA